MAEASAKGEKEKRGLGERKNSRAVGSAYEKWVGDRLRSLGYEILEYNFRCRLGEIDVIAREGQYLVFVEVKYRSSGRKGSPLEAVTKKKQRAISRTASYYCLTRGYGESTPCRFDVAAVLGQELTLIRDAFSYQEQ